MRSLDPSVSRDATCDRTCGKRENELSRSATPQRNVLPHGAKVARSRPLAMQHELALVNTLVPFSLFPLFLPLSPPSLRIRRGAATRPRTNR